MARQTGDRSGVILSYLRINSVWRRERAANDTENDILFRGAESKASEKNRSSPPARRPAHEYFMGERQRRNDRFYRLKIRRKLREMTHRYTHFFLFSGNILPPIRDPDGESSPRGPNAGDEPRRYCDPHKSGHILEICSLGGVGLAGNTCRKDKPLMRRNIRPKITSYGLPRRARRPPARRPSTRCRYFAGIALTLVSISTQPYTGISRNHTYVQEAGRSAGGAALPARAPRTGKFRLEQ
ncbi:hypothetical protein EVAR_23663_1 [Eumeta japonica]|uniref:Uncharacterized protein n=1 Tax=Eumeta variegata TaxID=151549 RepID=A0A4C1VJJ2_EUMVA|nr:hypothetical protein EVAR_23663_1 [Eumeta japonica]